MHVTVSEKAWMNEDKMMLFIKQILVPYYAETTEKLGIDGKAIFLNSDMFKAHLTDKVQTELFAQDYVPLYIPGGTTSKLQPLDVGINKPFKQALRSIWANYVRDQVSANPDRRFKVPAPSNELITQWVSQAWEVLKTKDDLIRNSFKACGLTLKKEETNSSILKSSLDNCLLNLKEEFGEEFSMENLEHGISDVLFNFDEFDDEMIDDNSSDEEEY